MPEIILPTRRPRLKVFFYSLLDLPLFWYCRAPSRFFSFFKNRLVAVFVLPLWLLLPPLLIILSFRDSRASLSLVFVLITAWWYVFRHPRYRLSEVKDSPLVKIDEVATRKVLALLDLDSNQFLSLAHRFPRIKNLLQRLEVELPLKFSASPLKIFRDHRVWEIAFREALETNADYLRTDHLFFGALAFEEMQHVLSQLNLKIEDLKGVLTWIYQLEHSAPVRMASGASFEQTLEILKFTAGQLEREHRITVSYFALTVAIESAAQIFSEKGLPDRAVGLLNEAAALARKAERVFVSRGDVVRLVSEKVKTPAPSTA